MVKKFRIWKLLNLRSKLEQRVASDERREIWDLGFGNKKFSTCNLHPHPNKKQKTPKGGAFRGPALIY
ncbi:hypothetical protein A7A78_09650 [Aequorivita soesokkakensis]|uniref:Uncharacterized protein n=1 Tax=Aequorivita soesokkakensis TaxID=1385699 RepID=A0A1A9LFV3_9FLAO|nr:hypothetical protein A7A78_09650 [Aequorivita soesokkakensis]